MKRIAIAIVLATVSTAAFATIQTDVVDANESENFKVECNTHDDGTIVHLVVRKGELDPPTHENKSHKIFDRNKQYPLHFNAWKKASNVYVWSAHDGAGSGVDGELSNLGPDYGWYYREIVNGHVVVDTYCNE